MEGRSTKILPIVFYSLGPSTRLCLHIPEFSSSGSIACSKQEFWVLQSQDFSRAWARGRMMSESERMSFVGKWNYIEEQPQLSMAVFLHWQGECGKDRIHTYMLIVKNCIRRTRSLVDVDDGYIPLVVYGDCLLDVIPIHARDAVNLNMREVTCHLKWHAESEKLVVLNLDKMGLADGHRSKYQTANQTTKHILNKTKVLMGEVHSYLAYVMGNKSLFPKFQDFFWKLLQIFCC